MRNALPLQQNFVIGFGMVMGGEGRVAFSTINYL